MSQHVDMVPAQCSNCDYALHKSHSFCPACGQKSCLHRLTLHDVFHDAIHYFVHVDKGFLQLIRALALRTGTVAKEYVSGRRKKYFPPLNFFLIAAALYVFAQSIYSHHAVQYNWQKDVEKIPDPAARRNMTRLYERRDYITGITAKYSNFIYMGATPFLTLIVWMFYFRGRYNYTEHLIASLYITGFCALLYAVVLAPLSLVPLIRAYRLQFLAYFIFEISYRAVFYNRFMGKTNPAAILKNWLVSLFVIIFWIAFSFYGIFRYIQDGFFGLFR